MPIPELLAWVYVIIGIACSAFTYATLIGDLDAHLRRHLGSSIDATLSLMDHERRSHPAPFAIVALVFILLTVLLWPIPIGLIVVAWAVTFALGIRKRLRARRGAK